MDVYDLRLPIAPPYIFTAKHISVARNIYNWIWYTIHICWAWLCSKKFTSQHEQTIYGSKELQPLESLASRKNIPVSGLILNYNNKVNKQSEKRITN